ncbi:hypothetical protein FE394_09045 [Xenorhabdus sp. Reich]|uniref:Lipoprotein n=2 Tax=Xenorhabdus littoralis TaxID=2582835 RepID=A0ABU4SLC8_9GAMM|nr:hypothetical protein [Xenorhabdus sp. Reich]
MRKIFFAATFVLSSLLLMSGCTTLQPPTQEEMSSANYGELPGNYEEQIKNAMSASLKDPYTAHYRFLKPFKGYTQDGEWSPSKGSVAYGWIVPVYVNAKNSYGGYVGERRYVYIFSGGVLYDTTTNDMFNRVQPLNQ